MEFVGLDSDTSARASLCPLLDQLKNNLVNAGTEKPSEPSDDLIATIILDEDFLEIERSAGVTVKVPSFNDGLYYLDLEDAFLASLEMTREHTGEPWIRT